MAMTLRVCDDADSPRVIPVCNASLQTSVWHLSGQSIQTHLLGSFNRPKRQTTLRFPLLT